MGSPETSIVVIEDDASIADLLDMYLRQEGFRVLLCGDAASGLAAIRTHSPRMVVLDLGLPGETSGLDVCRQLRTTDPDIAVMMLTARYGEVDRVLGLEMGADDYVTKPFSPREIVARVKAILRRLDGPAAPAAPAITEIGGVEVDLGRREARRHGAPIALATREFDLLSYLADHRGLALSRRQLLDGVWGDGWVGDERTVDVHVRQLRKKLGDDLPLDTVWGVGYRLG